MVDSYLTHVHVQGAQKNATYRTTSLGRAEYLVAKIFPITIRNFSRGVRLPFCFGKATGFSLSIITAFMTQ